MRLFKENNGTRILLLPTVILLTFFSCNCGDLEEKSEWWEYCYTLSSSYPRDFTEFNGALYFVANSDQIWSYDSVSRPRSIFNAPGSHASIRDITLYNNTFYFLINYDDEGIELWEYDAGSGCNKVALLSENRSYSTHVLAANNILYVTIRYYNAVAQNEGYNVYENEVWAFDGVNSPLKLFSFNSTTQTVYLTSYDNKLFFPAYEDSCDEELFYYNGVSPPALVYDINPSGNSFPNSITIYNNKLYFSANNGTHGWELWVYDGISDPTMVHDINLDGSSNPYGMKEFNNKLYFSAHDSINQRELWEYDGTNNPTMVYDINSSGSSGPEHFTIFDNRLYFSANDGINGKELWVYDGINNPSMVCDINPEGYSFPSYFRVIDGRLYFSAGTDDVKKGLWSCESDGSCSSVHTGFNNYNPISLTHYDDKIIFSGAMKSPFANFDAFGDRELWIYNLTSNATTIYNLNPLAIPIFKWGEI